MPPASLEQCKNSKRQKQRTEDPGARKSPQNIILKCPYVQQNKAFLHASVNLHPWPRVVGGNVGHVLCFPVKSCVLRDNSGVQFDPVKHTSEEYFVERHGVARRRASVITCIAWPETLDFPGVHHLGCPKGVTYPASNFVFAALNIQFSIVVEKLTAFTCQMSPQEPFRLYNNYFLCCLWALFRWFTALLNCSPGFGGMCS